MTIVTTYVEKSYYRKNDLKVFIVIIINIINYFVYIGVTIMIHDKRAYLM